MYLNNNGELLTILLIVKLVNGVKVMTTFLKPEGDEWDNDVKCAAIATDKSYLSTLIDENKMCASLDWSWASNPTYETGATYYKKRQVVEIYEPSTAQKESMIVPITMAAGSFIDLYITPDLMLTSSIVLTNTLADFSTAGRKYLISMIIIPSQLSVQFKTYSYAKWTNRSFIRPYPFQANKTHKLTFKALEDVIQILLDDAILYYSTRMSHRHRMLECWSSVLHKIDFVGM